MAYACSGKSNTLLVDALVKHHVLATPRVIDAFHAVDRAYFVRDKSHAYQDSPQSIGFGATISAPHMHAYALEATHSFLRPGAKVLDVGSGSGYLLPIYAALVEPHGLVVGIDHHHEITSLSRRNLDEYNNAKLSSLSDTTDKTPPSSKIIILTGDGRDGAPQHGPYDVIHVGAASPTVPDKLIQQLNSPGRMFVPVGTDAQYIKIIDKDKDGNVTVPDDMSMPVRYIALGDLHHQNKSLF